MTTQRAQQHGIIATQQQERTYMKSNFHLTCGGFLAKSLVNSLAPKVSDLPQGFLLPETS